MLHEFKVLSTQKQRQENETNYRTLFQTRILKNMVQGFFIMLLRQYFEAGINEVEEELDEMEGCALKIIKPEESI